MRYPENSLRVALLAAVLAGLLATPASADKNDLVLSRLGQVNNAGDDVIPDNQSFRSLASELGVALAPRLGGPAGSLGWSGFQFSVDSSLTSINASSPYWCATEESDACDGASSKSTGNLKTVGFYMRKGIILPFPSLEIGIGAQDVLGSHIWTGQGYVKFSVHEGFHSWPVPSVAVRGGVSRLFGSSEIDLTVASLDLSASKQFVLEGSFTLTPYAGFNMLWIVPRSQVLDRTPNVDSLSNPDDIRMNFVFQDQSSIKRQRFFGGLQFRHDVFVALVEVNFAFAGSSVDDRPGNTTCTASQLDNCDAKDQAGAQQTYSVSLGLDF